MSGFRFAELGWVHGLWLVLAFTILLILLDRRGRGALDRFVSRVMQGRLVARATASRRALRIAFLGLAGVFLVANVGAIVRGVTEVQEISAERRAWERERGHAKP